MPRSTALHMSYTVSKATFTAVKASISTPVWPWVSTVAVQLTRVVDLLVRPHTHLIFCRPDPRHTPTTLILKRVPLARLHSVLLKRIFDYRKFRTISALYVMNNSLWSGRWRSIRGRSKNSPMVNEMNIQAKKAINLSFMVGQTVTLMVFRYNIVHLSFRLPCKLYKALRIFHHLQGLRKADFLRFQHIACGSKDLSCLGSLKPTKKQ